ncbi:MAG: GNAT family N-acetyltransferase [Polyangiaceae bacterium]
MLPEIERAMAALPTLETDRLLLRAPALADLDAWAAFVADPVVGEFLGGVHDRVTAYRQLTSVEGAWIVLGFSMFSVLEKSSGAWVGRVGPWMPDGWPGTEVGWGIAREAWGKGYASEAARACIDFAFERLGWSEVIHCISPKNERSQGVAKRVGSKLRGPGQLPPPFHEEPIMLWGQTREAWRA